METWVAQPYKSTSNVTIISMLCGATFMSSQKHAIHREAFSHALDEHYDKLHESHVHIKTKHEYEELVAFLKCPGPKDKNTKKTKRQYYAMENYVVMNGDVTTGERDYLISKTVYEKARDQFGCIDLMKIKD